MIITFVTSAFFTLFIHVKNQLGSPSALQDLAKMQNLAYFMSRLAEKGGDCWLDSIAMVSEKLCIKLQRDLSDYQTVNSPLRDTKSLVQAGAAMNAKDVPSIRADSTSELGLSQNHASNPSVTQDDMADSEASNQIFSETNLREGENVDFSFDWNADYDIFAGQNLGIYPWSTEDFMADLPGSLA